MKAFLLSLLLFSLMVGAIILNSRYLLSVSSELYARTEALPAITGSSVSEEAEAMLSGLTVYWKKHRSAVSFTVQMRVIEGIDDALGALSASAEYGCATEFERAREHLLRITEDLGYYDRIGLGSLF